MDEKRQYDHDDRLRSKNRTDNNEKMIEWRSIFFCERSFEYHSKTPHYFISAIYCSILKN